MPNRRFERYRRGQLVIADFTPSIGSELKGKHLAIVLTKNDSPTNSVLTVIPLSSKEKPYYLNLGSFLGLKILPFIEFSRDELLENIKCMEKSDENIEQATKNADDLTFVVKTYIKMNKNSYALVQNISTVSKLRILKPLNKYDPIKKLRIDDLLLDRIDEKLIDLFTANKK
ncbi:type II toxin-antitoxin system PemK/MazF family toxin [Anaerorhabdus sp.]|uniref:type II toxin-antitoxin system PemK/MazF family toxin n=1 Tax=Anaerorhabdus sp. TaxID=1872524 RepID=UPI002B1F4670|nr:type II toxin-antitoxin system PemK/MazF family toxin [Anaerorhabdus sp.]MEA4875518.1 type II toxin-antitoxin system PemK/MazF family toxin [Anaerorhabdus sp.]